MMTKLIKTSISKWLYGLAIKLNPNLRFDNIVIEHTYPEVIPIQSREIETVKESNFFSLGYTEAAIKFRLANMMLAKIKPYIKYSTYIVDGHKVHEGRICIVVFKK